MSSRYVKAAHLLLMASYGLLCVEPIRCGWHYRVCLSTPVCGIALYMALYASVYSNLNGWREVVYFTFRKAPAVIQVFPSEGIERKGSLSREQRTTRLPALACPRISYTILDKVPFSTLLPHQPPTQVLSSNSAFTENPSPGFGNFLSDKALL